MAHAQGRLSSDVCEQELLPGIPDHITIGSIAPNITWKACNVLQMVSWGWQQAIYNRSVYNSKLFSKSTEGCLVLPHKTRESKLVLILYACQDGSSLQLPPAFPSTRVSTYDCICLDGKVYLWVVPCHSPTDVPFVEVRVLDLAGDRKWAHLKPLELLNGFRTDRSTYNYGVLGGEIHRSFGYVYPTFGINKQLTKSIQHKVPRTEVYNPSSDVWSLVTPKPLKDAYEVPEADLEGHIACFVEWAAKHMETDISKKLLSNGRYESYFSSEWRQRQQATHGETLLIRDDCWKAMANQVYYKTPWRLGDSIDPIEDIFVCAGKLLKFNRRILFPDERSGVIQMYNTEKNTWENWKSFSIDVEIDLSRSHLEWWMICGWAYADNVLWAILIRIHCGTKHLLRSPMFLEEESDKSFTFIDTRYSMEQGDGSPTPLRHSMEQGDGSPRPIYILWSRVMLVHRVS